MKVLVVDDNRLFVEGIGLLITQLFPQVQSTCLSSAEVAATHLQRHFNDMIVIDMSLGPDMTGLDLLKAIRSNDGPNVCSSILIASGRADPRTIQSAYRYGANAYMDKGTPTIQEFTKALTQAAKGDTYTPPGSTQHFLQEIISASRWDRSALIAEIGLWPETQRTVGYFTYRGLTAQHIGKALGISESDVAQHVFAVFRKLGMTKRAQFMSLLGHHGVTRRDFAVEVAQWVAKDPEAPRALISAARAEQPIDMTSGIDSKAPR